MKIEMMGLDDCDQAEGLVVVIDVVRAFTTAAYALAGGVEKIYLAGEMDEALKLHERFPEAGLMGELNGNRVPYFDLWNSPREVLEKGSRWKTLIHRSNAGTQGVVRTRKAKITLAASFVVAGATIAMIQNIAPDQVALVATGDRVGGDGGIEDVACCEYIRDMLLGKTSSADAYLKKASQVTGVFERRPEAFAVEVILDIPYCLELDKYDFAMPVERREGLNVIRPVRGSDPGSLSGK